jgi:hypothetical protein
LQAGASASESASSADAVSGAIQASGSVSESGDATDTATGSGAPVVKWIAVQAAFTSMIDLSAVSSDEPLTLAATRASATIDLQATF